ncbi:MAG TPA: hypothetical protein VF501_00510 [Thiobacillus sp.]
MKLTIDRIEILQHALVGYQARRDDIERRIQEVRVQLNGAAPPQIKEEKPKRRLSARGRANIIRATKERWRRARAAGKKRLG